MPFEPFREDGDVIRYQNNLPHWQQERVTYFVTFRLADSVPQPKLEAWAQERECWMLAHGLKPTECLDSLTDAKRREYHLRFTQSFHNWLDAGMGECHLRREAAARVVANALSHFHGNRYELDAWVVMPNHVHALVCPLSEHTLDGVLHSWKSYTAHAINKLLARSGQFWQHESYDHIVRSEAQLEHYRRYIRENPIKAKLREGDYMISEM
jgi:REP element-mobilizing transposase RayT